MNKIFAILLVSVILLSQAGLVFADNPCENYCKGLATPDDPSDDVSAPAGEVCFCNPIKTKSIEELINGITNWIFKIAMILGPAMVIVGGVVYITAAGDPGKIQRARKIIFWTIVGFLIILFAQGIKNLIEYIIGVK